MKILHVYKNYYPESIGGVEKCIYSLVDSLHKKGVGNSILTTTHQRKFFENNLGTGHVYYFPTTFSAASCPVSRQMLLHFKKIAEAYDIVHCHFPWPWADAMVLTSKINKPLVITYHSDIVRQKWLNRIYAPMMHRFLHRADAIVATSQNYQNSSQVLAQYQTKTSVIPIGVDRSLYPNPIPEKLAYWKKKVGCNFFLFIGVLRYYKGLEFLIEAMENTHIPLVIIGKGPEEIKLKAIAQAKKLTNVKFVGAVDEEDKVALIQLCRAVIAPSHLRSEAFCISLLEGLLFGKPLISTEINTGTSFVNRHNVSGLVVPPENPQALRQAMLTLLEDNALYQRLQQGAVQHYQQHFTGERVAAQYLEVYRKIS